VKTTVKTCCKKITFYTSSSLLVVYSTYNQKLKSTDCDIPQSADEDDDFQPVFLLSALPSLVRCLTNSAFKHTIKCRMQNPRQNISQICNTTHCRATEQIYQTSDKTFLFICCHSLNMQPYTKHINSEVSRRSHHSRQKHFTHYTFHSCQPAITWLTVNDVTVNV